MGLARDLTTHIELLLLLFAAMFESNFITPNASASSVLRICILWTVHHLNIGEGGEVNPSRVTSLGPTEDGSDHALFICRVAGREIGIELVDVNSVISSGRYILGRDGKWSRHFGSRTMKLNPVF